MQTGRCQGCQRVCRPPLTRRGESPRPSCGVPIGPGVPIGEPSLRHWRALAATEAHSHPPIKCKRWLRKLQPPDQVTTSEPLQPGMKLEGRDNPQFAPGSLDQPAWAGPVRLRKLNHAALEAVDVDAVCAFYTKASLGASYIVALRFSFGCSRWTLAPSAILALHVGRSCRSCDRDTVCTACPAWHASTSDVRRADVQRLLELAVGTAGGPELDWQSLQPRRCWASAACRALTSASPATGAK